MFARWKGRCFLWEFKRDRREIGEEMRKPAKEKLISELRKEENMLWRVIADRCHFLACGKEAAGPNGRDLGVEFFPYSRAFSEEDAVTTKWPMSLEEFVGNIVPENERVPGRIGVGDRIFEGYVTFLQGCTEAKAGVNGVVVKIDERGGVVLARFDGLEMLREITMKRETEMRVGPKNEAFPERQVEARDRLPKRERVQGPEIDI